MLKKPQREIFRSGKHLTLKLVLLSEEGALDVPSSRFVRAHDVNF